MLCSLISKAQPADPDQTVCHGQVVDYYIENPTAGSKYFWGITTPTMGNVQYVSDSDSDKKTIKWQNFGMFELLVYEQDEAGCTGPVSKILVQVTNGPTAEFDNAQNCYGEPLKIELTGTAPFSVEYTLDGEPKTISNISGKSYTMPNIPGKYVITKITDATCSVEPSQNKEAIIGKEMKTLVIRINN